MMKRGIIIALVTGSLLSACKKEVEAPQKRQDISADSIKKVFDSKKIM